MTNLLASRIKEAFITLQPILSRKVKFIDIETDDGNTQNKLAPMSVPPYDPAPHKEPCDQTTRKHDTPVGSAAQLSHLGRLAWTSGQRSETRQGAGGKEQYDP